MCLPLERSDDNTLVYHITNTKVEITSDNVLHMWCHDSKCLRDYYCRIRIRYRNTDKSINFELPAYNDCCTLPPGYIADAEMKDIGY